MEQLPVFVYGTLRSGQRNHGLIGDRVAQRFPARAAGLGLFGDRIPFALDRPGQQVVGELMVLAEAQYEAAMADLDRLEKYHPDRPGDCLYLRVRRPVDYLAENGEWAETPAWLYLTGQAARGRYDENVPILGGDWVAVQTG
ncbi:MULTISPECIES: gamma-glutamylcyclotransferase family protein [Amycolatopsis]|uniref:Gamma-glutamylcyclotransferase n=1 Tax=Amycolatopsis dendrobii TaxID=2760662 RepID=A0A7W3W432_9PSEU|nr:MULTISPECIES: gamma-glutamylcyclotransferase family protein [Amycolatopsis]MBB1158410.1 gamma-glutamylcyclotransferase [Amycolatopsis dendrobii]UKD56915.1 gamma-glutamylcyclotransferase [Amycolatopsis sp. FU40]